MLTNILEKLRKLFSRRTYPDNASTLSSRELCALTDSIGLYFRKEIDLEPFLRGLVIRLVRLVGDVSFRTPDGWSITYEAIIDTGCPITVIPRSRWENIEHHMILPEASLGLGGGTVTGQLGEVTLRFRYNNDVSPPITIKAHLLDSDDRPLILGFEDILTDIRLVSDFAVDTAYLEFPYHIAE